MHFFIKKIPQNHYLTLVSALFSCFAWTTLQGVQAQSLKARITVASLSPARLKIEAEGPPTHTWSFRNTYGGIVGLAERVENFQVSDPGGQKVEVRKPCTGRV